MARAKAKKKKKFQRGVKPLMVGLVYQTETGRGSRKRMIWQADAPAMYAEAMIGAAEPSEISKHLEWLTHRGRVGAHGDSIEYIKRWKKDLGRYPVIDDLAEAVRKSTKKSGALVSLPAVGHATNSEMGTLVAKVKSRMNAVDAETLKLWQVTMSNFEITDGNVHPNFSRACQCGFTDPHLNRRKLWSSDREDEREFQDDMVNRGLETVEGISMPLHLSCYHEAAVAVRMGMENSGELERTLPGIEGKHVTSAFDFKDKWHLVFEAFARRYVFKQKYAEIDNFLWEHDVESDFFKELRRRGEVRREVLKYSRWFDPTAKKVIMELHERMLDDGYTYAGFAREFVGVGNKRKQYQTAAISYRKGDVVMNIVYDNNFWIPFVVKKMVEPDSPRKVVPYMRNPVRLVGRKNPWVMVDDATGQKAMTWVIKPKPATVKDIEGAAESYRKYMGFLRRTG